MNDKHIEPTAAVMEVFKGLKGEARTKALQSRAGKQFYAALETKQLGADDEVFADNAKQ